MAEKRLPRQNEIVTKRMNLNDSGIPISEEIRKSLKDAGIENPELIRKGIATDEKTQYDEEERTSVDYITTKTVDRDGDIVVPGGAMLDHYRKNPVVLFVHDYKSVPVGKALWIKSDKHGLISKTKYVSKGKGNEIWEYRKEGFPMAKSIGFIPFSVIEEKDFGDISDEEFKTMQLTKDDLSGAQRIYPKWLMLEYSDVPVPSNPDALQLAISKGIINNDELQDAVDNDAFVIEIEDAKHVEVEEVETDEVVNKPETTDNYHHIPVRDAGEFVDGSFRTINITDGIKAVIGKLKSDPDGSTKIQKYLFDINKYTMEEAQTWVNEHKDQEPEEQKAMVEDPTPEQNMLSERYGKEAILDIKVEKDPEDQEMPEEITMVKEVGVVDGVKRFERMNIFDNYAVKAFNSIDNPDGLWNTDIKNFEIQGVDIAPRNLLYDLASKWLKCPVKSIYMNEFGVPSALIGTFLTGLEKTLEEYDLIDTRNFRNYESPPVYDTIRLTADKQEDFLIEGIQFYEKDEKRVIISRSMSWSGLYITIMSDSSIRSESKEIISKTWEWTNENNFLKGQKFSLSGKFLETDDEDWDSVFLTDKNFKSVKSAFDIIESKGIDTPNRGIMLVGPPGTGKTMSCRITMNKTNNTFIWVSARDFRYSSAAGGMSYAFSLAKDLAPTILCIEDIDNWLDGYTVDILKSEMDGIVKSKGVVTFLTSNYPERVPEALIDRPGRFHDVLNFSYPSRDTRVRMLEAWCDVKVALEDGDHWIYDIVKETENFSGAHMYELVSFAKRLMEDDENLTIEDAVTDSLNKIIDQRALIRELRGEKDIDCEALVKLAEENVKKDFTNEKNQDIISSEISSDEEIIKAGRVLSKNTRQILGKTLFNLEQSVSALKEFMEAVDQEEKDEPVVEIAEEDVEEVTEEEVIEITPENLKSAILNTLGEFISQDKSRVNIDELVVERVNKAKGKIF